MDAVAQHGALFVADGEQLVPTPLARGPWDPNALHGGPVAAVLGWLAERHDPGPASFVARVTVELLRPVPLAPLRAVARTMRPGGKVQWVEAALLDGDDREVACARALRVRAGSDAGFAHDVGEDAVPPFAPMPTSPDETATQPIGLVDEVGFWSAFDFRLARGDWRKPGPGAAWIRLRAPVVAGEPLTPLQRVCAAADMGSGVGNAVRLSSVGTINPELTVHVHRDAVGEWIGLDSRAWAHPHGAGMAESVIHDRDGACGRSVQSLLVIGQVPFIGRTR